MLGPPLLVAIAVCPYVVLDRLGRPDMQGLQSLRGRRSRLGEKHLSLAAAALQHKGLKGAYGLLGDDQRNRDVLPVEKLAVFLREQ
jgi:hypothetical protein